MPSLVTSVNGFNDATTAPWTWESLTEARDPGLPFEAAALADRDDVEAVVALRCMLTSASRLSIKRMPGGWTPAGGSPQGMSPRGVSPVRTSGDTYSDPITRGASPGGSSPRGDVQYLRGRSPTPPLPALKASASATTLASTMGRSEEEVVSNQYLTAPLAD